MVYLSIGSNLGDRFKNLQFSISELSKKAGKVISVSNVYETDPVGFQSENLFLNACLKLETSKPATEILQICNQIESLAGRIRTNSHEYESRLLDIDIIFFGNEIINSKDLKVPHPHFRKRQFVLMPLNDLDKDFIDPVSALTLGQLLLSSSSTGNLRKIDLSLNI